MKSWIKKFLLFLFSRCKIKNVIVFESKADFSDNSKGFFDYLIENKYNEKYKIYWFVGNKNLYNNLNYYNVKFVNMWTNDIHRNIWQWLKYFKIVKNAKYLFASNRSLKKLNNKTISVYMNHGTPLKQLKDIQIVSEDVDYVLVASEFCIDLVSKEMHVNKEKIICIGNPRDDIMFKKSNLKNKIIEYSNFKKIILWLPTFRQSSNTNRIDSNFSFPLGIPIIYDINELKKLNSYLKKNKMVILFKLHPSQKTELLKIDSLTNINIITDDYLFNKNINLCELYKASDALITDYSSVFFDYYQLNKPIGFTLDDFEEYKKIKGFVFDNPLDYMAGYKIYKIEDLYKFLDDITNNQNKFYEESKKMKKLFNKYSDDESSKRLVEFLKM